MIDPNQAQNFLMNLTPEREEQSRPMTSSQQAAQRMEKTGDSEIGTNSRVESFRQTGQPIQLQHKNIDGMSEKTDSQISQRPQDNIGRDMKSPNFFQMSGIPKFGKNWLDNFIPDEEMQNTFMTSEVVRNVLMLQCIFYASVYNELVLYKHTYINQKVPDQNQISMADLPAGQELPDFKVGIIGCGQVGTVLLTKLLEVKDQFHNLKMIVSTR